MYILSHLGIVNDDTPRRFDATEFKCSRVQLVVPELETGHRLKK